MDEPVVTSRKNRTQPDCRHSTEGETLPVAMGRKMGVKQRRQAHPFHLRQQQGHVVDALCDNALYLMHPQSLTQSGIYLQICPNGKASVSRTGVEGRLTDARASCTLVDASAR